jgi:hypothetical protein
VTCLFVVENDGIATAVIDVSHDPAHPVGEIIVGEGLDEGDPVNGISPDLWRLSFESNGGIYPSGVEGCWLPFFGPVSIQQGNIRVSG